jgi:hypothetical protein
MKNPAKKVPAKVPQQFQLIMQRVKENDRAYFQRNPFATEYRRPYVPGEAYPLHNLAGEVLVMLDNGEPVRIFTGQDKVQ